MNALSYRRGHCHVWLWPHATAVIYGRSQWPSYSVLAIGEYDLWTNGHE
jgi:hypothetical protein